MPAERWANMTYFKLNAEQLHNLGYQPFPITPGGKEPLLDKGDTWQKEITEKEINQWLSEGKGKGNVAVTALGGIDCDIRDREVSNKLLKFIRANINNDIPIRIGQPPKFLCPVSPNSEIHKKRKLTYHDQDNIKHEIEFLCPHDQYFVTHGIHPDTNQPYKWHNGNDILKIKKEDLPVVDETDILMIEDEFDRLAHKQGWSKTKHTKKENNQNSTPEDKLANHKPSGQMSDPASIEELKVWLSYLPKKYIDDYDLWLSIGAAIHHETGGSNEGWIVFDEWSQKNDKYSGKINTIGKWESFGKYEPSECITRGTIIHVLQEQGLWKKAEKEGKNVRQEAQNIGQSQECVKQAQDVVSELNQNHAIINIGGKIRVIKEHMDPTSKELIMDFLSIPDFHVYYANKKVPDPENPKKKRPKSKLWIEDPGRREYEGIVFEPAKIDVPGYYNLWRGFAIEPKKGDWSLYYRHIIDNIADGNQELGDWVIAWMARAVQDPGQAQGDKPGTSIVLQGGQGTGKGVMVNTFGSLFGEHFLSVSHGAQIAGRFNSHLKNKIVVFIDEGFWAGDKAGESVLKSIVTEPDIAIEQKGIDIIRVRNHINLLMASNNDWVVPANFSERRFQVLKVGEAQMQNKQYFSAIIRQMNREDGKAAMLYDMLDMDISGYNLGKLSNTEGLLEQKIHSMSTEQIYWFERLQEGEFLSDYIRDKTDSDTFTDEERGVDSGEQYEDYLIHAEKKKERYPLSKTQFGLFLKKVCPKVKTFQKRYGDKRRWRREFPHINDCRDAFETVLKTKIPWDESDDLEDSAPF